MFYISPDGGILFLIFVLVACLIDWIKRRRTSPSYYERKRRRNNDRIIDNMTPELRKHYYKVAMDYQYDLISKEEFCKEIDEINKQNHEDERMGRKKRMNYIQRLFYFGD